MLTCISVLALLSYAKAGALNARDTKYNELVGDWTGSTASYADGSGQYVESVDVNYYGGRVKCWTDVFFNMEDFQSGDWSKLDSNSIDCASTSSCSSGTQNTALHCSQWTLGGSIKVDTGDGAKWLKNILSIGASVEPSGGESNCQSSAAIGTCTWDDKGCHALWTSTMYTVKHGYVRRRCDKRDGKGDVTVWSKDWQMAQPTSVSHLGCAASCNNITYPDAKPTPPKFGPEQLLARMQQTNMTAKSLITALSALNATGLRNATVQLPQNVTASNATLLSGAGNGTTSSTVGGVASNATSPLAAESAPGNSSSAQVTGASSAGNSTGSTPSQVSGTASLPAGENNNGSAPAKNATGSDRGSPASSSQGTPLGGDGAGSGQGSAASNTTMAHGNLQKGFDSDASQATQSTTSHGSHGMPSETTSRHSVPSEAVSANVGEANPEPTSSSSRHGHPSGKAAKTTAHSFATVVSDVASVQTHRPSTTAHSTFAKMNGAKNGTIASAEPRQGSKTLPSEVEKSTAGQDTKHQKSEGTKKGKHGK